MLERLTAADARRWAVLARAAFAARRAEIDALNVFPVPDGDTGTNLYLTLDAALDAVRTEHERPGILGAATLEQECTALGAAMLLTARGNSGRDPQPAGARVRRGRRRERRGDRRRRRARGEALARAERAGLRARDPTRSRAPSSRWPGRRPRRQPGPDRGLGAVTEAALDAATEALARPPTQLPALERAGVVDAGAAGYLLLLEALARVAARGRLGHVGDRMEPFADDTSLRRRADWEPGGPGVHPTDGDGRAVPTGEALGAPGGPAYEVMYLLRDSDEERVDSLRDTLDGLGDSLLVVGRTGAVERPRARRRRGRRRSRRGCDAGRPYRVRVTHFADQVGSGRPATRRRGGRLRGRTGPGRGVRREAGAQVVASGPGRRASAGQLLEAARAAHALAVIVLPNDRDTVLAAEAAARGRASRTGIDVHVVRSRTAVQGLAALAVFDPDAPGARNAAARSSHAAAATRHGAVAVASKEALTSAGPVRARATSSARSAATSSSWAATCSRSPIDVVRRLLSSGGELVTVVGRGGRPRRRWPTTLAARVERGHRDVEVSAHRRRPAALPLLLGVE